MYRCIVDFEVNVGRDRFIIPKNTIWNIEEKNGLGYYVL